jgi:asparagine synthase (glutamine-hydrolysing)
MVELRLGHSACLLGHRRLRIIDLSEEADQPMTNEDATVWVSYNGEIYNHRELRGDLERSGHRFRSSSDTEVLVHLYEEADGDPGVMLPRLRGMFAFAIADTQRGRLLLSRDRLGIKPLYFEDKAGRLSFGSEVRAVGRVSGAGGEADLEAASGYLVRGVVPGPRTILAGVRELPAGAAIVWKGGKVGLHRWWTPGVAADVELATDAPRVLSAALNDAVRRHLVTDRPVGIFLSGGVDSGAIARLAAQGGEVKTLTVALDDAGLDEGMAAARAASALGTEHETVQVDGSEVAEWFPRILSAMDQPTSDGVNTWLICKAARDAGLVVALSGLGGDELFGGYSTFTRVPSLARLNQLLGIVPRRLRERTARSLGACRPGGRSARVLGAAPGFGGAFCAMRSVFSGAELESAVATAVLAPPVAPGTDPKDRVCLLELSHYLSDQLLRDTDQMSMAHSLEVRVPLLDDPVVRLALALPAAVRLEPGKGLLVKAAGLNRPAAKRCFTLPFDAWMRGPLKEAVREGLLSEDLPFRYLVPAAMRQRVWTAFELGKTHWSRPWAIAVLRLWPAANGFQWQ